MSTPPPVGPVTAETWGRLPELYRDADEAQGDAYPLLRYLSLIGDQLTPVLDLLTRLTYTPHDDRDNTDAPWARYGTGLFGDDTYGDADTADLVDPARADEAWLPWLAQLLGVPTVGLTPAQIRDALVDPSSAWEHGTPGAIAREAARALPEGAYVDTRPLHGGDPHVITLITKNAETYGTVTWGDLMALAPTWAHLESHGMWGSLEAINVLRAAEAERPAGFLLRHTYLENLGELPDPAPPIPEPEPEPEPEPGEPTPPPPVPTNPGANLRPGDPAPGGRTNLLGISGGFESTAALSAWNPNPVFGAYPNQPEKQWVQTSSATVGEYLMAINWSGSKGCMVGLYNGLTPGASYQVALDARVANNPSVVARYFLSLLFTMGDVPLTGVDSGWKVFTSPVFVAESTQLWIGITSADASLGESLWVDNIRLYQV